MTRRSLAALLGMAAVLPAQQLMTEGKADSPVQVVIYEDLQCPDCAAFRRMMDDRVLPAYGSKAAFVHKDFPLAKHVWARKAAVASRFFSEKDPALGLAYRRATMASIKETTPENFGDRLAAFARQNGVDPAQALAALNDPKYAALVERDYQDGVARGVARTPTVLVNGTPFIETFTFEELAKGIDQALAETR